MQCEQKAISFVYGCVSQNYVSRRQLIACILSILKMINEKDPGKLRPILWEIFENVLKPIDIDTAMEIRDELPGAINAAIESTKRKGWSVQSCFWWVSELFAKKSATQALVQPLVQEAAAVVAEDALAERISNLSTGLAVPEPVVSEPVVPEPLVPEPPVPSEPVVSEPPVPSEPVVSEPLAPEPPAPSEPVAVAPEPVVPDAVVLESVSEPLLDLSGAQQLSEAGYEPVSPTLSIEKLHDLSCV
jgi:hypothetical protein